MQKCEWINLIDGRGQNHKAMQVTIGSYVKGFSES